MCVVWVVFSWFIVCRSLEYNTNSDEKMFIPWVNRRIRGFMREGNRKSNKFIEKKMEWHGRGAEGGRGRQNLMMNSQNWLLVHCAIAWMCVAVGGCCVDHTKNLSKMTIKANTSRSWWRYVSIANGTCVLVLCVRCTCLWSSPFRMIESVKTNSWITCAHICFAYYSVPTLHRVPE